LFLGDRMAYNNTNYESFYGGAPDSFSSNYGNFSGEFGYVDKDIPASQLSYSINPMTADQLGEVVKTLKSGVKNVEVQLLGMDQQGSDQIVPIQHFKEMRALMKLSGVKPSMHGPLIDAAGFGERGWGGKYAREDNERRMLDAIEKAHMLDPAGNIPIVFHSTNGIQGAEFRPDKDVKPGKDGRFKEYALGVINRDTGQVTQAKEHGTYYLSTSEKDFEKGKDDVEEGGTLMTARGMIDNQNATEWDEKLKGVVADKGKVDRALGGLWKNAEALDLANINLESEADVKKFNSALAANPTVQNEMIKAQVLQDNNNLSFRALFDKAYKYGTDHQRDKLKELSNAWKEESKKESSNPFQQQMDNSALQDKYFSEFRNITSRKGVKKNGKVVEDGRFGAPELYQEVEEFAMDKAAETFGNLAKKSYDKFGGSAPVIAVENMYQGMAFSKADDLKALVKKSRNNFVKQLKKDGLSQRNAEKIAEKQLGVTWDVGHLNLMKKRGFTEEDVLSETKKISKDKSMVKHVHLTDNFGYSDSHLVPGMGNVPFKQILEELEKTGRYDEMAKVIEAGGFVNQFKRSAVPSTLAAFGSPIYGMAAGPGWNQVAGIQGAYFGGYGTLNPEGHHGMYGAGFTTMPMELGGQMAGGQSRFGGTPMA
jgi:hypothetical protein